MAAVDLGFHPPGSPEWFRALDVLHRFARIPEGIADDLLGDALELLSPAGRALVLEGLAEWPADGAVARFAR